MNKSVWIFQYKKEVEQKGEANASWYVGWYDLAGKRHAESCGPGARGKNQAEKRLRRIQSELDIGVHQPDSKKSWEAFRAEYEEQVLANLAPKTVPLVKAALDNFERIVKPKRVEGIITQTIDSFIAKRRQEPGKKPESLVSPATINKDLRHLKAVLRIAHEWGYLAAVPKIRMVKEPVKLPLFVTPEHFGIIYHQACPLARLPAKCDPGYTPAEWWQALIVTAYMTGLRINEILSIRKSDLDLEAGQFITRWDDNKGKRDEAIPLHPVVVEHLRKLIGEDDLVFRWGHDERTLWQEFGRIQREAGIHLSCPEKHGHTEACHVYGFHDFRRAFATVNAPRMKPEALQKLMRHKSYQTTLSYVNLTNQLDEAVKTMPVPDGLMQPPQQTPPVKQSEEKKWDSSEEGENK
jgi:integrase